MQFQQNSGYSTLTKHNDLKSEDIKAVFELISLDLKNVNEQIRKDFAPEMDYAITALNSGRHVKPQLCNIGTLIKDVGIGLFTNLLDSPMYESIKPLLGL
ncbi:hypothetical protein D9M71_818660 [compost metagenome]